MLAPGMVATDHRGSSTILAEIPQLGVIAEPGLAARFAAGDHRGSRSGLPPGLLAGVRRR